MKKFKDCRNGDIIYHVYLIHSGYQYSIECDFTTIKICNIDYSPIPDVSFKTQYEIEGAPHSFVGIDDAEFTPPFRSKYVFEIYTPSIEAAIKEYSRFLNTVSFPVRESLMLKLDLLSKGM